MPEISLMALSRDSKPGARLVAIGKAWRQLLYLSLDNVTSPHLAVCGCDTSYENVKGLAVDEMSAYDLTHFNSPVALTDRFSWTFSCTMSSKTAVISRM